MPIHRQRQGPPGKKRPAARGEEIAFLLLGGAYSLAFWGLQGCQIWLALQRLL